MNVTAQAGDTLIHAGGPAAAKQVQRIALRRLRKAIPTAIRRQAAQTVAKLLLRLGCVLRARRVAVYLSMGSELDTSVLITALRRRGIATYAPVLCRQRLRFRRLSGGRLRPHRLGMSQPIQGPTLAASAMTAVLLPLLGFDSRGQRLGQGGGYYDRTLVRLAFRPYRIGLAFAAQHCAPLPAERWDQPLHAVLTERGLHRFSR